MINRQHRVLSERRAVANVRVVHVTITEWSFGDHSPAGICDPFSFEPMAETVERKKTIKHTHTHTHRLQAFSTPVKTYYQPTRHP